MNKKRKKEKRNIKKEINMLSYTSSRNIKIWFQIDWKTKNSLNSKKLTKQKQGQKETKIKKINTNR